MERLESVSYRNIGEQGFARKFPALNALLIERHVIPGLHRNFVPQGIDFVPSEPDTLVLSGYFCGNHQRASWQVGFILICARKRSAVYLFDLETSQAVRLALLEERDGEPMRRHVGGVAVLHDRLWLPDNFEVLRFDLSELLDAENDIIAMRPENARRIGVDSSGDFITSFGETLWIGNFHRGARGRPLPSHYRSPRTGTLGWTAAYEIDPDTLRPVSEDRYTVSFGDREFTVHRPDGAIHHRGKVQGMQIIGDRHVVLSASWGPSPSALSFHRLPAPALAPAPGGSEVSLPDGSTLDVPSLAVHTRQNLVFAPPGSEDIAYDGERLAIPFEGGAMPYRLRWSLVEDSVLLFVPPGRVFH